MQIGLVEVFSIVSALVSTALAVFAIWQAEVARREAQKNSTRSGEVLKEIEGHSVLIKDYVARSQQDMRDYIVETQKSLMAMQERLVSVFTKRFEADIPQRVSPMDQTMMRLLTESPEKLAEIVRVVQEAQTAMQETSRAEDPPAGT